MRLAQNITRVAARNVSYSSNNTSLTASRIPNSKTESTAVKSITTPKNIRTARKFPSACSGVTLSDRVAIDGFSNTVSCFSGAVFLKSNQADILGPSKEDQGESLTQTEQPSQRIPTGDNISLQWNTPVGGDIQRSDPPLSPRLYLEGFLDYCFETPLPKAAMVRTSLSPPPPPRPDHAMIDFIRPPIPEELLVPVF
jgi:hypothetical protein